MNVRLASLIELVYDAVMPGYDKHSVYRDSAVRAHSLYNAGTRLAETSELLEMVLLKLSCEDILFAQLVNRKFRAVVLGSRRLQQKRFLDTEALEHSADEVVFNPMIAKESALSRLPLYFAEEMSGLRYCPRSNRRRLRGMAATMEHDVVTGESRIKLQLTDPKEVQGFQG